MAQKVAKVAISLPWELLKAVEQVRRELRVPRSVAIAEAVQAWLKRREEEKAIRQYIEGYRKHPESKKEAKAWTRLAADSFHKDPW